MIIITEIFAKLCIVPKNNVENNYLIYRYTYIYYVSSEKGNLGCVFEDTKYRSIKHNSILGSYNFMQLHVQGSEMCLELTKTTFSSFTCWPFNVLLTG